MRKEVLEEFDKLMECTVKISHLRVLRDNPEYSAFRCKRGEEVRICSSERHLEWLPHVPFLYSFFKNHKIFWLIPCCTPNVIAYGYILRSFVGKEYRAVSESKSGQLVYGFEEFKEFQKGSPIVLVEGVKDAIFVQMEYKYCLAMLSSSLTKDSINFLTKITDRFIIGVDNDESGKRHRLLLKRELTERNCRVADIVPQGKDYGDGFSTKDYSLRILKQQLSMAFKKVEYNDSF